MTTETDNPPGYELVRRIGSGATSVVWEATQLSTGRRVALKVLDIDITDPAALRRFERERKVMSSLASHPGIVTIYDAGVHRHKPWLAMEYCRRGSLAEHVAEHGPLEPVTALAVLQRCAAALGAAHARDIVHCDVKPQNIMLTDHGDPAIGDFGIARVAVGSATTTSVGGFTLDHAAPELLEGGKSSPASDVYALGTTVWELLAGRPPFREHRDVAMAAIMMRILTQPVPEPPEGTPAELAALLRSMTAKQPGERPADMTAVAASAAGIRSALVPVDPLGSPPFPAVPTEPDPEVVLERADTVRVTPWDATAWLPPPARSSSPPAVAPVVAAPVVRIAAPAVLLVVARRRPRRPVVLAAVVLVVGSGLVAAVGLVGLAVAVVGRVVAVAAAVAVLGTSDGAPARSRRGCVGAARRRPSRRGAPGRRDPGAAVAAVLPPRPAARGGRPAAARPAAQLAARPADRRAGHGRAARRHVRGPRRLPRAQPEHRRPPGPAERDAHPDPVAHPVAHAVAAPDADGHAVGEPAARHRRAGAGRPHHRRPRRRVHLQAVELRPGPRAGHGDHVQLGGAEQPRRLPPVRHRRRHDPLHHHDQEHHRGRAVRALRARGAASPTRGPTAGRPRASWRASARAARW